MSANVLCMVFEGEHTQFTQTLVIWLVSQLANIHLYSGAVQPPAHLYPASMPDSMLESSTTLRLVRYTPEMLATKALSLLT